MRQMMRQLSGSGMFGGGGLKGKLMRRVAGMTGMPDISGMGNGDDGEASASSAGPSRKRLKKKRRKKKR
jgi:hypothetical protein